MMNFRRWILPLCFSYGCSKCDNKIQGLKYVNSFLNRYWRNTFIPKTRTLLTIVPSYNIGVPYYYILCDYLQISIFMTSLCFVYCCPLNIYFIAIIVSNLNIFDLKAVLECWSNEISRYLCIFIINKVYNISLIYFLNS